MFSIFSRDPTKDFGYELQEPVSSYSGCSFWNLHKAVKKGSGEEYSVFVYDVQKQGESWLSAAKSSLKRLKTMKHPNILLYVDGLETDKLVYMATEPVMPLAEYLQKCTKKNDHLLAWGLFQILKALSFLNETANLAHHNISVNSVFVNKAGEWKLGGLDYVTSADSDSAPSLTNLKNYLEPPEYTRGGGGRKGGEKWSTDMWGYGVLIYEVFNGHVPSKDALKQINNLPEQIRPHYPSLISTNPKTRISPSELITRCTTGRGFFQNPVIDIMTFLDEIQLRTPEEKLRFFGKLSDLVDSLPEEVGTYRVLPQLLNTFEFGPADNSTLPILLKLGKGLKDDEYQKRVIPVVVKLFSSTDRGTRMQLLQQMKFYIDHLSSNCVNNQLFPHIVNGFLDTNPAIREETVKSIVLLAPKLNSKNLNEEVMKHFARIQTKDEQGAIRTNTTVCIGKVAPCLSPDVRLKVLVSAFSRALRDPFTPCRVAGAVGFIATHEYFSLKDVAARVLPSICCGLTDPDKEVRDQTFKTVKLFLERLEKVSENPDLKDELEAKVNAGSVNIVNSAANWAGWAVSSLTAKFYKGKPTDGTEPNNASPRTEEVPGKLTPTLENKRFSERSSSNSPLPPAAKVASADDPSSGWGDAVDDWAFLQESKSNLPNATPTAAVNSEGWDDADWSTPIDEPMKLSSIPTIKPPPKPTNSLRPMGASPFANVDSDSVFSSIVTPKTGVAPAPKKTSAPATRPSQPSKPSGNILSPVPAVGNLSSNKAASSAAPAGGASWDSWDNWESNGQPAALKPSPVAKAPPANKSLKLVPRSQDPLI